VVAHHSKSRGDPEHTFSISPLEIVWFSQTSHPSEDDMPSSF